MRILLAQLKYPTNALPFAPACSNNFLPPMKSETVQFYNNLSSSAASQGSTSHSHEPGGATHSHDHGVGEHGHTHEHLEHAGKHTRNHKNIVHIFMTLSREVLGTRHAKLYIKELRRAWVHSRDRRVCQFSSKLITFYLKVHSLALWARERRHSL